MLVCRKGIALYRRRCIILHRRLVVAGNENSLFKNQGKLALTVSVSEGGEKLIYINGADKIVSAIQQLRLADKLLALTLGKLVGGLTFGARPFVAGALISALLASDH